MLLVALCLSAEAAWAALLLFPRLLPRPMENFTSYMHLHPDPVADYHDNRLAHWAFGDMDTLFSFVGAHASLGNGGTPLPASFQKNGTHPLHHGVLVATIDLVAGLIAVGQYHRAMEALNSNRVETSR
jgi:hypothetical protein